MLLICSGIIIVAGAGWEGSEVCGGDHVDAHGGRTGGGGEHYFFTIHFSFSFSDEDLAGWSRWRVAFFI
jgi:hypothetical protein